LGLGVLAGDRVEEVGQDVFKQGGGGAFGDGFGDDEKGATKGIVVQ